MKTPKPLYTFEIIESDVSKDGKRLRPNLWYWRCRHRNGKIISDGAEGYSSKAKLRRSLDRWISGILDGDYEIKEAE